MTAQALSGAASTTHRQAAEALPLSSRLDGPAATLRGSRTGSPRPIERLRRGVGREVVVFGAIGIVSTAAYAALYLVLRSLTGAVAANAVALGITAVGNTAANRRLTFGIRGGRSMARHQVAGLVALGVALAITTVSVNVLDALAPDAGRLVELAVLIVANALATVARFVLLRAWIAGDRSSTPAPRNP